MAKNASPQPQSVSDINVCVSTSDGHRKEATFQEWMVSNQIGISLTILAMLVAVHNLYPSLSTYTAPFFELSYYQPSQGLYTQGRNDIYFVISSIVTFTAVRAIAIEWILQPLARKAGLKKKAALRFGEQGWLIMYDGFFWSFGMYIWSHSSYWLNFEAIWAQWPARGMSGMMKWYLLAQLSFWLQQIIVVNIEEKRKDYYQMFTHHIITSTLLGSAYIYGFYNVSNVVLCLMDVADILLPLAKILKYLKYEALCTATFVVMLVTWLASRHVLYLSLCWSIYKNVPAQMAYGCYSGTTAEMLTTDGYPDKWAHLIYPFLNIDGPICMNRTIKWIFLSFLLAIHSLSLLWFGMIIHVAIGVLRTGNAEEPRSDDEEEELSDIGSKINGKNGSNGTSVTADSSSAEWRRSSASPRTRGRGRVRLGDQNDRKALLGRIGCEKPVSG